MEAGIMKPESDVVYGPVRSRRFGWDLGINLLPAKRKLCTFDCVYCQYGFSGHGREGVAHFPDAETVLASWQQRLSECESVSMRIRHTTVAGNGEPTMHPEFSAIAQRMVRWRNENAPYIRLAVLSNGYRIHLPEIRYALGLFEEPILKLDSGDQTKLLRINQPLIRFDLDSYIANLKRIQRFTLQSMFLKGWNDGAGDLTLWISAIRSAQPESVQIYTLDRTPAMPGLQPLSGEELHKIARDATIATGIPVHAYL